MTKQRKLILDIINQSTMHLTAEDIHEQARKIMPSIAVGTVYRNLGLLTKDMQIRKIDIPERSAVYDRTKIPHEHLVCTGCGCIKDIEINQLKELIMLATKAEVENYSLTLYYKCDNCKNKKS